ncbi:MAG: hypothetical protein ABJL99_03390 [Aliishimia sp.]
MPRRLSDFPSQSTALGIEPAPTRSVAPDGGVQRLRFHKGRSLDHDDLRLETQNAEARFGLMARVLADGVIDGFKVAMSDQAETPGGFDVSPGYAISPQGQDLTLNRHIRLNISDLPRATATNPEATPALGGICVLVLEPVSAEETRFSTSQDRSAAFMRDQQLDPDAAPFQDARIIDGARITLVRLNTLSVGPNAPRAINTAVAELTEAERTGAPLAQYSTRSVALCLIGIGAGGRILWVHRHGAARKGGGLARVLAQPKSGLRRSPRLTQARVDSLLESLSHLRRIGETTGQASFTDLPPAGVLPFVDSFDAMPFPSTWATDVVPIPMGQLDALLAQSEALAGYDLSQPLDEVRIYVPVPDALFEPGLLETPSVSSAFFDARSAFEQTLADRLEYRDEVIKEGNGALLLVDADERWETLQRYDPDPDAIPEEDSLPNGGTVSARDYNTEAMSVTTAWRERVPDTLLTTAQLELLEFEDNRGEGKGLRNFITKLQSGIDRGDDFIDFGFTKVQAEIYRLRQILLDAEEATKLATFPVLAGLAKGSNALAISKGLQENFQFSRLKSLQSPAAAASDSNVGNVDRQFLTAMLLPIESTKETTSLVLSGLSPSLTVPLKGTTALTGAARGDLNLGTSGNFGLTIGVDPNDAKDNITTTVPQRDAVAFAQPTVLTQASLVDSSAYLNIFNASRDIVYDEIALADAEDKRAGITFASAIPGDYRDLRTVTIADRLAASAAQQARTAALRTKADTLAGIAELEISMVGVKAPVMGIDAPEAILTRADFEVAVAGFVGDTTSSTVDRLRATLDVLQAGATSSEDIVSADLRGLDIGDQDVAKVARVLRLQQTPVLTPDMVNLVLGRRLDNDPSSSADESELLASAVEILESTVAVFRTAERRVAALRGVLKGAVSLLENLEDLVDEWRADLDAADVALSEGRHDVQAMRALFDEETARIDALRQTRRDILRNHVKFFAYARPRRLRAHSAGLTTGRMLSGVFDDPLPLALERPAKLPEDLAQMMEILRDVPIGWFDSRDALLADFAKPALLDRTYHWAANAAAIRLNARKTLAISTQLSGAVPILAARGGKAARARKTARQISGFYVDLSSRFLLARQQIDLGRVDRQDWRDKRKAAAQDLSLNDLIEGAASSTSAARALREVEQIDRVVSSLYVLLRRVPPAVRLLWADKLSVFDGTPVLTDIARLPGWTALTSEARFDIRRLHAWLFARMMPGVKEASALMSDVLQVALLLAANAESDAVVKARLEQDTTVEPGGSVELALDLGQPEIGTPVWFGASGSDRISGTIANVFKGRVQVDLSRSLTERVTLRPDMAIFVDAKRLSPTRYGR